MWCYVMWCDVMYNVCTYPIVVGWIMSNHHCCLKNRTFSDHSERPAWHCPMGKNDQHDHLAVIKNMIKQCKPQLACWYDNHHMADFRNFCGADETGAAAQQLWTKQQRTWRCRWTSWKQPQLTTKKRQPRKAIHPQSILAAGLKPCFSRDKS